MSDASAPDTSISAGPSGTTTATSASVSFASSESGSTFECRLDGSAWGACSSPKAYTGLAGGSHSFDVRAIDAAGNVDATPASRAWTIDASAPDTSISAGPSGTTAATTASVSFDSSESGSTFECRLDGSAWGACSSPKAYTGLAGGSHTFDVRATDAAGNADATAASRTWTVTSPSDTTAPDTSISAGPSGTTSSTSASVSFASSESGSTFECRLDGSAWGACSSPKAYTGLASGSHSFDVRAIDAAGNVDASPAFRTWTIDASAPDTSISAGPSGTTAATTASVSFASSESGSTFECRLDSGAWATCASPKAYSGLPSGSHSFEVRASDAAGNVDASPASRAWTIDASAPDTSISAGPSGTTTATAASVSFASSESGSTFECRLDGSAWGACSSPKAYTGLAGGSHNFDVRAIDAAGNVDATPASRAWTVGTTPSGTVVWQDDFERTSILGDKWRSVGQRTTDHMAQTSTTVARDGGRSARFELRDGDIAGGSDERQQLADMMNPDGTSFRPKEGDEYYIATSHYFVAPFPGLEGGAAWQVFWALVSFDADGNGPLKLVHGKLAGQPVRFAIEGMGATFRTRLAATTGTTTGTPSRTGGTTS